MKLNELFIYYIFMPNKSQNLSLLGYFHKDSFADIKIKIFVLLPEESARVELFVPREKEEKC